MSSPADSGGAPEGVMDPHSLPARRPEHSPGLVGAPSEAQGSEAPSPAGPASAAPAAVVDDSSLPRSKRARPPPGYHASMAKPCLGMQSECLQLGTTQWLRELARPPLLPCYEGSQATPHPLRPLFPAALLPSGCQPWLPWLTVLLLRTRALRQR